ncbi:MAG TPA: polysaccharide deacetylase family protein [Armatimonadota bacterium]|jgi:peptidoglycan/xylan/chitin deacetylase (PgdA/CDA1 family)
MSTPILMYHEVSSGGPPAADVYASWTVTAAQFRQHLAALRDAGYVGVSVPRWQAGEGGAKPVVLTFDDGFAGNVENVIPALAELGWSGTFFVISGKMGTEGYARPADWAEAFRLGMDVASHTVTHPFAALLPAREALRELADSRAAIEDAAGAPVVGFSWPNGDAHREGHALLKDAGYAWAATSLPAFASRRSDPLALPRLPVRSWHDSEALMALVGSGPARRLRMLAEYRAKRAARALLGRRGYASLQRRISNDDR